MPFNVTVFILGTLGGVLAEVLKWFHLRESQNWPEYAKRRAYWIITALMAIAGGVLAWAYGIDATRPLLAINIGISAPLIIKGLAGAVPAAPKDRGAPAASIRNFLAGV